MSKIRGQNLEADSVIGLRRQVESKKNNKPSVFQSLSDNLAKSLLLHNCILAVADRVVSHTVDPGLRLYNSTCTPHHTVSRLNNRPLDVRRDVI